MKLHSLDLPEISAQAAVWLDRQLVGASVGELVAELAAARADLPPPANVDVWLGDDRRGVLSSGLSALPAAKLSQLLAQPYLLPAVQELVLLEGGPYWQQLLSESPELAGPLARGREALDRIWASARPQRENGPPARTDDRFVAPLAQTRDSWLRHPALASLATAAVLLLAFFVFQRSRPAIAPTSEQVASGWGWNKTDALPDHAAPAEYLNRLADGGQAWFNKRPDNAAGVAQRILELRQGCSRLLLADHKPLSNRDREWLVERCYRWAAKFDSQVSAIEQGDDPLKVRAEADATVRKLIDTLKARANEIATG